MQFCQLTDAGSVPNILDLADATGQVRMLLPKRPLRARTFRLGAGQTVSVGGVARVDVLTVSAATLYLTLWASDEVSNALREDGGRRRKVRCSARRIQRCSLVSR